MNRPGLRSPLVFIRLLLLLAGLAAGAASADNVIMVRADYFENYAGAFLSVEAKSSDGSGVTLSTSYSSDGTNFGSETPMEALTDGDFYLYHRILVRVAPAGQIGPVPAAVRVRSSAGGVETLPVRIWAGATLPSHAPGYMQGFATHYLDPQEAYASINNLAGRPDIAEVIQLPFHTNGYQRPSSCVMAGATSCSGTPGDASAAVYLEAKVQGQHGGNDIRAQFLNPGVANAPLSVSVAPYGSGLGQSTITVTLATSSTGALASTAAQVVAAINANSAASDLVTAYPYGGQTGAGIAQARALVNLSDFLSAPSSVPRGPFQMQVLRIGKVRDGSKVGVFIFCGQHGNQWVTPNICVETAERLVSNYGTDPQTTAIVDNLDVFIWPGYNPDGSNYSFYDSVNQRKNMTRYCPVTAASGMPANRHSWGVDNDRNNVLGSIFDGYDGGSSNCTSGAYAGPSEMSEPENRNQAWIADTFGNIRFSMNIHSFGGYLMWSPGAYIANGRVTLPQPNIGVEGYFFSVADTILSRIKQYRGTVLLPARTGSMATVRFSQAGNSTDDQYYANGIIAFDLYAGADRFASSTFGTAQSLVGFSPNFAAEGYHEMMESANGVFGLLEEALKYANDTMPPVADMTRPAGSRMVPNGFASNTPMVSTFQWVNEPAVIHYTLDGSTPTLASPVWRTQQENIGRLPGELFSFTAPRTTVKWITQDMRGYVSAVGSKTFYVDANAPTIAVTTPANGASYALGQVVRANYSCQDEAEPSGLSSCVGPVANGAAINTATIGLKTFTVNAADHAGNTAAKTNTYSVVDNSSGLLTLQVVPSVVNLRTAGLVTAVISVPAGFDLRTWGLAGVTAFGVPPASTAYSSDGRSLMMTFNKSGLTALPAGNNVTFAVSATSNRSGAPAPMSVSTNVRVIR